MTVEKPTVYTVVQQLPIESDGRIRYRIKSQSENFERVVTEELALSVSLLGSIAALKCTIKL